MAILQGLSEEISTHPELQGASREIIINKLNTMPGSGGTYVVMADTLKIPKGDILALLSAESIANVIKWMRAEGDNNALAFHELYIAHDQFAVTNAVFRSFIELLAAISKISEIEKGAILRLGERLQTRSEELWGRAITNGDFE